MNYVKRTVHSQPGLSQEQALIALQSHPSFKPGTRIASIRRKGANWIADILEPKQAGPPPFGDDGAEDGPAPADSEPVDEGPPEGPPSDGPDEGESDSPDGPPSDEGGEKPKGKGEKKNVEADILHVLQQILQAVGGDAGPEGMGGPDGLGPDAGGPAAPPPPHHGPDAGGPPPPHGGPGGPAGPPAGRPMKPGEAPPGSTPVGAPAFSSTRTADMGMPVAPGAPGATAPVPSGQAGPQGATCPQCGYPEPCPMHGAGAQSPMTPAIAAVAAQVQKVAGRSAQVTIKAPGSLKIGEAVKVAKAAAEPFGYEVKKASRVDDRIIILAYAR